jgi:hypothetical protein
MRTARLENGQAEVDRSLQATEVLQGNLADAVFRRGGFSMASSKIDPSAAGIGSAAK